ncbi:serine/threonine-protein kinase PknJ [Rhodococcus sp. MTM3W5.2]|uniref:serine/threonine-protein kinase PknD n=1 Tax=Rhodococcus sp. MTM3W5.2 TaxID=1805827 RepID=UPI0009794480|nr:serine/threonine-protein kinase PknD [Rhodococcus sp. MTM3W5.2]AQA22951.1 serine/threonine-protein kinase PknJ [Rhodococcus sp. MTM3W5.2]
MGGEFEPGTILAGYRIERVLGRGGMGDVYLADHPNLPRQVALKVLHASWTRDDYVRSRFESEADHAARLEHPNIVTVHDRGREGDLLWIAMQYVPGVDAKQALESGPLDVERAVHIISETAKALDYAHGAGVLHRDVKPANILLAPGEPERVLLTDLGTATRETLHLTQTGMLVATLLYAAPEQIQGGDLDHRVDIYALGCTFFHLITGQPPFAGSSAAAVMNAHLNAPIPRPSVLRPELPGGFDIAIARAMAKNRDDRFSTCRELVDAARAALLSAHESATRPSPHVVAPSATETIEHAPETVRPDQFAGPTAPSPMPDRTEFAKAPPPASFPQMPWWRRRLAIGVAALVALIVGAAAVFIVWPESRPASEQVVLPLEGLGEPFGVATSGDGDVYVTDQNNNRVIMKRTGVDSQTVLPFTGLSLPSGIAVSDRGDVYVADSANNRVVMLRPGSDSQTVLPFTDLKAPLAVAVGGFGDVYVADTMNNRVLVLPAASSTATVLPFPGLIGPYGVAVNDRGDVYVSTANNAVLNLSAMSGTMTVLPFKDVSGADAVAVSESGDVFVADGLHNRVLALPAGSDEQTVLPFTGLDGPVGLAVNGDGDVYVADLGNSRVLMLPAGSARN